MATIPPLADLGRRIMIMGLTNSGKSTLAVALSGKLGIPAVHLDQLQHRPNTNWEQRPEFEFVRLHDAAITGPEWIIDGSYSRVMPQRLARATGIIVVTDSLATRYRRYVARTLLQKERAGALEGGQDRLNWKMLGWLWKTRNSVGKYQQVALRSGLPHVFASSWRELDALYAEWNLTRPSPAPPIALAARPAKLRSTQEAPMLGLMMSSPHRNKLAVLFAALLALGLGVALLSGALV